MVTLDPTYEQITNLQKTIQDKLQVLSDEKRSLREAFSALNNIQYTSRTVEVTPRVPPVLSEDGSDTIISPEIPAVTEKVYDVLPSKTNNPSVFMIQQDIKNTFDYWNNLINETPSS